MDTYQNIFKVIRFILSLVAVGAITYLVMKIMGIEFSSEDPSYFFIVQLVFLMILSLTVWSIKRFQRILTQKNKDF